MTRNGFKQHLFLLLAVLLHRGSTQNISLRINTNVKEIEATAIALPSIQGPGNICIREEPYVEHIQVPEMQPVRVRTSSWCMEIPPRCSTYKTEMREVMKVQVSCNGGIEWMQQPNIRSGTGVQLPALPLPESVASSHPVATPSQWPLFPHVAEPAPQA
ncbi:GL20463 [Drosophila persimilis]|uniref:GL20463 n=1 Tax=Drosophila persimilis TaxID=7234 RepID=B4GX38_DROPE|nr:GL20463 [Drosophila persimilis]